MSKGARRLQAFVIAAGVLGADRWTKQLIETRMNAYDTKTVIPGFFDIVRSENTGVAFGMFAGSDSPMHTALLIGLSMLAVLLLAAMLWRIDRLDTISANAVALIFGGAIGNVYDRVHVGRVTDFLDFYLGTYHWYTFNLADAAICVGASLLLLSTVLTRPGGSPTSEVRA